MKELVFAGLALVLVLTTVGYVGAHSNDFGFDFSNKDEHKKHYIEMHGNDEGFEEMHANCLAMHGDDINSMEEHHEMMHGGD